MLNDDRKMRVCMMAACGGKKRNLVHKFPSNAIRAEQWRQVINQPVLNNLSLETIRKRMFVCTHHFRPEDYKHKESRSLNQTAVPSLLLDSPSGCESLDISSSDSRSDADIQHSDGYEPELLRFEIKFDSVELLHPSGLPSDIGSNVAEYLEDEEPNQNDDSHSILEPDPHRANIYTLLNTNTSLSRKRRYNDRDFDTSDGSPSHIEHHLNDEAVEPEEEEVVVMSLSSDIFQELQNQLMQQEKFQSSTGEIIVQSGASRVDNMQYDGGTEDDVHEELHEVLLVDDQLETEEPKTVFNTMSRDDCITVVLPDGSQLTDICNFWLRDQCRCPECYDNATSQRKLSVVDIPIDIKPISFEVIDNQLFVTWVGDHSSVYDIPFLESLLSYDSSMTALPRLWSRRQIEQSPYARVTLNNYLCDDMVAKSILTSLIQYGVAFIENVPTNMPSTEMVVKRLFPIQKTCFGEMWSFADNKEHSESTNSKSELSAHTDNTYFNDAGGLQVLHCLHHSGTGGDCLLLDGFNALDGLKKRHQDAYDRLCEVNVPAEYIEEKQHHTLCAPIIRLHPMTGKPEQIRFNLYDRSPMNTISQSQMLQFYTDLRLLSAEIQSPDNEWWFKLNPGTVVIFDNWRILHGRSAYTGRRLVAGCYVSRTEFHSAARTLGVIS